MSDELSIRFRITKDELQQIFEEEGVNHEVNVDPEIVEATALFYTEEIEYLIKVGEKHYTLTESGGTKYVTPQVEEAKTYTSIVPIDTPQSELNDLFNELHEAVYDTPAGEPRPYYVYEWEQADLGGWWEHVSTDRIYLSAPSRRNVGTGDGIYPVLFRKGGRLFMLKGEYSSWNDDHLVRDDDGNVAFSEIVLVESVAKIFRPE